MSLVTPTRFTKTEKTELEELAEAGRKKAQHDYLNETMENTVKQSYENEMARLRAGQVPPSQEATPSPTTQHKEPSPMQKQINLGRAYAAQHPEAGLSKPTLPIPEPSPDTAQDDNGFALKVLQCWNSCHQAQKDFPSIADFFAFCLECAEKEAQLKPHHKGIVGLPYYTKLLNLQKGRVRKG